MVLWQPYYIQISININEHHNCKFCQYGYIDNKQTWISNKIHVWKDIMFHNT